MPFVGAVGANGCFDPVAQTAYAADFTLTPSGQAEQENATLNVPVQDAEHHEEVPGAEPESPG